MIMPLHSTTDSGGTAEYGNEPIQPQSEKKYATGGSVRKAESSAELNLAQQEKQLATITDMMKAQRPKV